MRVLHTSDWHLGRTLHGADLGTAHARWVDHVVEVVRSRGVDVVLVAGDVFDRAIAPVAAIQLWDHALTAITSAGAQVVVSSGNHDSPVRLAAHGGLLARAGVHVRSDPARLVDPVLLRDEHGPVAVFALPFLEPVLTAGLLARSEAPGCPAVPHIERTQAAVVGRACELVAARARADGITRTVLLAHTWAGGVTRADLSDSERDIGCAGQATVGTLDRVGVDVLAGFTYVALGHLHGRRRLRDNVRYSGSPVAFSFSERHHRKGSWLVDLAADGLAAVEAVDAPLQRRLAELTGTLADLLTDPAYTSEQGSWVKAVLTDPQRPADAMARLQTRFPHALVVEHRPVGRADGSDLAYADRLRRAPDDLAVALGFVEHVRGTPADPQEQVVLADALAHTRARLAAT